MANRGKKGHIAGGKVTRSHTTVTDAAAVVVKKLEKAPEVSKISLGEMKLRLGHAQRSLKCLPINGGLKVVVRGVTNKQELFVYTSDTSATEKLLATIF